MNEIRFDLADIFNANLDDDIIFSINMMNKKMKIDRVIFWHNGEMDMKKAENFINVMTRSIPNTVRVVISKRSPQIEYVWFDVISDKKAVGSKSRFSHIYPDSKKMEILAGIHNFFYVSTMIDQNNQAHRIYYKPSTENDKQK